MAEYIEREKLLREIEHYHVSDGKFQHWVQLQPAADVTPVVRGQWLPTEFPFMAECEECSVCGYRVVYGCDWHYCPNCGARMDEHVK